MASLPTVDVQPQPESGRSQPDVHVRVRPAPTQDDWRELERRAAETRRAARDLRNRSVELRTVTIGRKAATPTWDGYWLKP
jgi:hypothetical protein